MAAAGQSRISDDIQVQALLEVLSSKKKAPDAMLDPAVQSEQRKKQVRRFGESDYSLHLTPEGAVTVSGDMATVPVRVVYQAGEVNSMDASATSRFIKRDGEWYFADYDFMGWPTFLIVILVVGLSVGIAYAATVVTLASRLVRRGSLWPNIFKIYIPFFCPALSRQSR